jgi:serine protease
MINLLKRLGSLSLLVGLLAACGGGDDEGVSATRYTVSAVAGAGGTVSPDSQSVASGEAATVSVDPNPGYAIESVAGCDGNLSGSTYTTAPVTSDCTVTASFVEQVFPVTGNVSGLNGSLTLALTLPHATDTLTVTSDDANAVVPFVFDTKAGAGEAYEVTVAEQPQGQECTVENGFGEVNPEGTESVNISCVAVTTTASLSGAIVPTASIDVDSDVNDLLAEFADNSAPSLAQPIFNRATLHGFASAQPTGGSPDFERFANEIDRDDFYSTTLQAGQIVQLQVVDFEGFESGDVRQGDLDLYLWDEAGNVVGFSDSVTEFEEIVVPATGRYLVNIYAYSGISKYVLRFAPAATEGPLETAAEPLAFVPRQMVVKFKEGAGATAQKPSVHRSLQLKHQQRGRATLATITDFSKSPTAKSSAGGAGAGKSSHELQSLNSTGYAQVQTLREIKAVRLQPDVAYAEPNYIRRPSRTPDDRGYWYQWHYDAIQLPQAWEVTTGGEANSGPIVAVIDTGIFLEHPDLTGQLVDGYDFISDPNRARDRDGIDPNPDDPGDQEIRGQSSWHGTHVAGTVAAQTNNGRGVAGVAWGAEIMPIRVLGAGGGTSYDIIQGVRFAAGLPNDSGLVPARRADIANLSLGGPYGSVAERDAYREAQATGMIIVAAAGNESTAAPSYPAAYDAVISVSAADYRDRLAPYSNYGETIELAAPGGNMAVDENGDGYPDGVLSTSVDDTSGAREPSYVFYHGTSMAAPHVAGVVALMKALYPELNSSELRALIQSQALTDDLGPVGRDNFFGYGRINARKAVEVARDLAAGEPPPEPPPQVVAEPTSVSMELNEAATVDIINIGGGNPVITNVTVQDAWLSVVPDNIDDSGLGTYLILADRSGLAEGTYDSTVIFTVDNGTEIQVRVFVQVGDPTQDAELAQPYVLLLEKETRDVVDVVVAEEASFGWRYLFTEVPVGSYYIIAGSDIDVDNIVCQSGESCGAYPTLNNQQPVQVVGDDLTGLDFLANILGGYPTTGNDPAPLSYSVGKNPGGGEDSDSQDEVMKRLPLTDDNE